VGSILAQIEKSDDSQDLHLVEDWSPLPTLSSCSLALSQLECAATRLDLEQAKYLAVG